VEDEGRPSSFCFGVARVHLIYRTLRKVEGATPKLSHYPSQGTQKGFLGQKSLSFITLSKVLNLVMEFLVFTAFCL